MYTLSTFCPQILTQLRPFLMSQKIQTTTKKIKDGGIWASRYIILDLSKYYCSYINLTNYLLYL